MPMHQDKLADGSSSVSLRSWRPSHPKDSSRISFLDLPRELRDEVYRQALFDPYECAVDLGRGFIADEPRSDDFVFASEAAEPGQHKTLNPCYTFRHMRVVSRQLNVEAEQQFRTNRFYIALRPYYEERGFSGTKRTDPFYCYVVRGLKEIVCECWPYGCPKLRVQVKFSFDPLAGHLEYQDTQIYKHCDHLHLTSPWLPIAAMMRIRRELPRKLPNGSIRKDQMLRIRAGVDMAVQKLSQALA